MNPGPSLEVGYCYAEAWRLGGDARAAADPLVQAGLFGGKGGELGPELIVLVSERQCLLLLSTDQSSGTGHASQSGNGIPAGAEYIPNTLTEMPPGIKPTARVQQGRYSLQAIPAPEWVQSDLRKRSVIEGRIGTSKRKYGLDWIIIKLFETLKR